jgi:riboflavin synthase
MFTGIVEAMGDVTALRREGTNLHITVSSVISGQLKIDQSVAHDGVCLTVVNLGDGTHTVTAIAETLARTSIQHWQVGQRVNLERCMRSDGRFDGHIVQGHVDATAVVKSMESANGSHVFTLELAAPSKLLVNKGSVTVNGVSLTCFDVSDTAFSVAIIPYTYQNTVFQHLTPGATVNIEFDIIGKYVQRMMGG